MWAHSTMDNRHHWQDVTVGSLVGIGFSFFAYRQYYPPLSAPDAHVPFEPRYLGGAVLRPAVPTPFEGVRLAEEGDAERNGARNYFELADGDPDAEP